LGDSGLNLSAERQAELGKLETAIGYPFKNRGLLDRALTHKSFAYERQGEESLLVDDYESLEFLGDAILGFIIAEFLFLTYSELTEGALTKLRAHLVSTRQLATMSRRIDLGLYIRFSRGEKKTGGGQKKAILADVFESLVAAVYLDGGLRAAREFVLSEFREKLAEIARGDVLLRDHKSALQEAFHRMRWPTPRYRVIAESGPEHRKEFLVSVLHAGEEIAKGKGQSKKEAEQQAAEAALSRLGSEEIPEDGHGENIVGRVSNDGAREAAPPKVEKAEE
jgi:ribonuclease-3